MAQMMTGTVMWMISTVGIFFDNNNDLTDLKGHGTFISGIIAAKSNNGIGIAGINPGAVIMPLKVADKNGNTDSLNIARAILYAVDKGAKVINISLGGRGVSKLEQLAINYAYENNVFVTVASGNIGENISEYGPAAANRVLTVGSLDFDETRSTISHWGANNGLLAPGEEIYSLYSKDSPWMGGSADRERLYFKDSGTSFSTPMVTATASLLLAKNPNLTNKQLEDILLGTATDIDNEGWDEKTGAGILNAAEALRANPDDMLTVKITGLEVNRDGRKRLESVDVFGTVRGKGLKEFTVGLGKGKRAGRFKQVAGPFNLQADHNWLARIDKKFFKGSKDWVVQLKATDKDGNIKTARLLFYTK